MRNFTRIFMSMLITVFVISCHDETNSTSCDVENPAEDLSWMKIMIESWETSMIYEYLYMQQGTYLGKNVFLAGNCCPVCDTNGTYIPIYNCEGEELENVDVQNITHLKIIWKPDGSTCTL